MESVGPPAVLPTQSLFRVQWATPLDQNITLSWNDSSGFYFLSYEMTRRGDHTIDTVSLEYFVPLLGKSACKWESSLDIPGVSPDASVTKKGTDEGALVDSAGVGKYSP